MAPRVTIKQVAEAADVAVPTAYQVLRGGGRIAAATRARVLDAVDRLGYVPNRRASDFARGRTDTIGFIYGGEYPYLGSIHGHLIEIIARLLAERGFSLSLIPAPPDDDRWQAHILGRRIDACLLMNPLPDGIEAVLATGEVPAYVLNHDPDIALPRVCFDDAQGIDLALDHLHQHGHRRIAYFGSGDADHCSTIAREAAYRADRQTRGAATALVLGDEPAAACAQLIADPAITAVVAYSDQEALRLMAALHAAGRQVPADLSVIGVNDSEAGALAIPALTSVNLSVYDAAAAVVEQLTEDLQQGRICRQSKRTLIAERLVERDSVATIGPPPA